MGKQQQQQPQRDHKKCSSMLTLGLRGVGGDGVEDVDQHEEERDEEGHPAWDHLRGDHEADPRDHHEQTYEKKKSDVIGNQTVIVVPVYCMLKTQVSRCAFI